MNAIRTRAEGGLGNALCRRRRRRIEIPRRVDENDDHYRGRVWGIWPDSVGEEDRDSLDAGAGETAEESERGTYRQLSYAQALKKTGCQSVEATIRQRRLRFAGAMARQPAGRLPKRLMDGKLVGGEDSGKGRPEKNWMDYLKGDFQAFGATDASTVDNRLTFGVDRAVWTLAAKMGRRGTRGCCRERKKS